MPEEDDEDPVWEEKAKVQALWAQKSVQEKEQLTEKYVAEEMSMPRMEFSDDEDEIPARRCKCSWGCQCPKATLLPARMESGISSQEPRRQRNLTGNGFSRRRLFSTISTASTSTAATAPSSLEWFDKLGARLKMQKAEHFPSLDWTTALSKKRQRELRRSPREVWRPELRPFIERRPQSLQAVQENGVWEYFEAILDSGATVTVIPPHIGRGYDVLESAASKAGITYEIANGDEIPNLGEKLMPIMTSEGTTRGLRAQVADVSKPLQAVRSLVRTGHLVVFGDGEDGNDHYIVNKMTGECNAVRDDGTNYLMGMYVIPKTDMHEAGFGRPVVSQ